MLFKKKIIHVLELCTVNCKLTLTGRARGFAACSTILKATEEEILLMQKIMVSRQLKYVPKCV